MCIDGRTERHYDDDDIDDMILLAVDAVVWYDDAGRLQRH